MCRLHSLILMLGICIASVHGNPSAQSLLNSIPSISLSDEGINSFYVEACPEHLKMNFILAGQDSGNISMVIVDNDKTPWLVAKNNSVAVYEPTSGTLITSSTLLPEFELRTKPDESGLNTLSMEFGLIRKMDNEVDNRSLKTRTLSLNLPSLVRVATNNIAFTETDNASQLVTGFTDKGNKLSVTFGSGGLEKLNIANSKSEFLFSLNRIVINKELPSDYFDFPHQKLIQSGLSASEMTSDDVVSIMRTSFICYAAMESISPELSQKLLESNADDLQNMKKNREQSSEALKLIFKNKIFISNQKFQSDAATRAPEL